MTRILQLTLDETTICDIEVRVSVPERDPVPGGDWRVLVEISGFEQPFSNYFHGVDEFQALLGACAVIPTVLTTLTPAAGTLSWLGNEDLGFTTPALE